MRNLPTALLLSGIFFAPRPALAADLLIQDFSSGLCTPNNLGGPSSDGATMAALDCATGVLASTWNATADYWYTQLTPDTSGYNLSTYDYLSFDFRTSTPALRVALRLTRGNGTTVLRTLNSWSAESLPEGLTQINVPISDYFAVTVSTAVREIRFMTFYPAGGGWLELDNIYARKEMELKVTGVDMKNATTIRIDFNAPVAVNGATASNYSLSPAITVNTATRRDNNRVVQLTLASALALNTTYTLTVNGVGGLNGAVLGTRNTGTFIGFSKPAVLTENFNRDGQAILDTDIPAASWPSGGADLANGNWFSLSTTTLRYGNASLFVMDASTLTSAARIMYNAGSPFNEAYHRFYFYAPQRFFDTIINGVKQSMSAIEDTAYNRDIAFYLTKTAGIPVGYIELNDSVGSWLTSPEVQITPDRWNSLELYVSTPGASTNVKVWLNGNRIANLTSDFTDAVTWQNFYVGLGAATAANKYQRGLYFDEVVDSSITYVGQIEKPNMVYASATAPDTVKVYFDRAVSPNEVQWQSPATYSFDPSLTINSATIEDDFRAVSLNTSAQADPAVYALSVNSVYLADGAAASANLLGLNPAYYLVDDFNRPNNSTLPADSPKGVWNGVWDDSVNSVTVSTSLAFLTKASLRAADVDAANSMALVMKNVNISSYAYVRAYVYLDGNFFTAMSNGQARTILQMDGANQFCSSGNSQPCGIVVYANKTAGGEQRLSLEFNDTADLHPGDYSTYISTGVWNSIEILVPSTGTTAAAQLYLNGSLRAQVTGNVSDAGYWSRLYLGLGWASDPAFQQTAYYDEVAVSTTGYVYSYPLAYAWNGSADTSWLNAANWTAPAGPAHPAPPGPEDIAVIDSNASNQPVINSSVSIYGLYIATTGVYGSTLTLNYPLDVSGTVFVGVKGVITHTANTTAEVYKTSITATAMQIDGLINVTGKGYAMGRGPGTRNDSQLGAGYGGQGGIYEPEDTPGAAYGSYSAPANLGSGGGDTANGGPGGGAVLINVSNALTVSGSILADGGSGGSYGSGSGGSIYITAGSLSGGGTLRAQGGYTSSYASGAGGRLAVIASTSGFTGGITAYAASDGGQSGGAGTVFIKTPGTKGTLIIDNNNITTGRHAQVAAGDYTTTFDEVRLNKRGDLWLPYPSTVTLSAFIGDATTAYLRVDGNINFAGAYTLSGYGLMLSSMTSFAGLTDLTVGGALGAIITHERNTTAEVHKASFSAANLTIAANSSIDVSGRGYSPGRGPGAKNSVSYGAGYGGQGGCDDGTACAAGAPYGNFAAPLDLGSGGGGITAGNGGPGGGAVIINVSNALMVSGSILADGGSGGLYGSGSGGSIYITAGSLSGGGTLRAQGGYTSSYASGAGGRLAVIASTSGFTGGITAYAASDGNESGGAGTVFIKTPGTNGTLIIDNNNIAAGRYTGILAGDNTFDSVYSVRKSSGAFLSFSTLTVKGENVFFDGDNTSTITVSGNVYGGSFPEVYISSFSVKWGAAGNPTNAQYTAEISSHADYSLIERSSVTYNRMAWCTGVLNPNTTYYARTKVAGYATLKLLATDYIVVGGTITLSAVPGTSANPFTGVFYSSITLSWLANGNPPYTEFRVQASTASDFSGTLYGPAAGPASWLVATSTTVVSLPGGDTEAACGFKMFDGTSVLAFACSVPGPLLYFRVQSRNLNSVESGFEVLGSTTTLITYSRLKMHKAGVNYNILLVDPGDVNASKLRIQTPEGIKAVKKLP